MSTEDSTVSEVKRYNSLGFHDELGMYVRWSDYDAVATRLAEAEPRVKELEGALERAYRFIRDIDETEEAAEIEWRQLTRGKLTPDPRWADARELRRDFLTELSAALSPAQESVR